MTALSLSPSSPLAARALAFPATLSLFALQGAIRGARDTRSPLGGATVATLVNVVLDPLLILGLPSLGLHSGGHSGLCGPPWCDG